MIGLENVFSIKFDQQSILQSYVGVVKDGA
jgi:hypothetical protein